MPDSDITILDRLTQIHTEVLDCTRRWHTNNPDPANRKLMAHAYLAEAALQLAIDAWTGQNPDNQMEAQVYALQGHFLTLRRTLEDASMV